jgi:predicted  nucleic acid-binding Zn-ribbon protein
MPGVDTAEINARRKEIEKRIQSLENKISGHPPLKEFRKLTKRMGKLVAEKSSLKDICSHESPENHRRAVCCACGGVIRRKARREAVR